MKVTIAIPFFKDEKYIKYAIQSVLNQTFTDWELILINDGGCDRSLEIAESFARKDPRIRVINDSQNKGLAYRLNETVKMAQGIYYARMDADDIMYYKRIEEQVKYMDEHPLVDVVGCSAMLINAENEIVGSHDSSRSKNGFLHPTVFGRTQWFLENPYSVWCKRCQDKELWLRTSSHSNFFNLKTPLLFYREAGTVTFKKYLNSQKSNLQILRNYKSYRKSFFWYLKSALKVYAGVTLYYLCSKMGFIDMLIAQRKRQPLPANLLLTVEELNKSMYL